MIQQVTRFALQSIYYYLHVFIAMSHSSGSRFWFLLHHQHKALIGAPLGYSVVVLCRGDPVLWVYRAPADHSWGGWMMERVNSELWVWAVAGLVSPQLSLILNTIVSSPAQPWLAARGRAGSPALLSWGLLTHTHTTRPVLLCCLGQV